MRTLLNRVRCRSVSWGTMPDPAEARLAEVVAVLSMATDLGTGQPMERGIRTCLAGVKLAELLGVDAQVASDIYYTLALSALGCTADSRAAADMLGDEVTIGPAFAPIVHAPVSEALPVVARAVASGRPLAQRPWAVARFMAMYQSGDRKLKYAGQSLAVDMLTAPGRITPGDCEHQAHRTRQTCLELTQEQARI